MSSILTIAQSAADICAVQRPTTLVNPTNQNDQLFASVVNSALDSLMRKAEWQQLEREGVLFTTCGQTQYALDNIASDIHSITNASLWMDGSMRSVIGAITQDEWRTHKQYHIPVIDVYFKIQNNKIEFLKDPQCLEIHFGYKSNAVCFDAKTLEPKAQMTADSDIPVFDEYLVKLAIIWRWLKRTGLDYTEEYNEYERELAKSFAETKATGDIDLSAVQGEINFNEGIIADVYAKDKPCC